MSEPGAIPTTTTPSTPPELESIPQACERPRRRPWKELGRSPLDFAPPYSFGEAIVRLERNLSYFYANYGTIMLIPVLWYEQHTFLKIVFLGWILLYFYRDEPLVVFNYTFDDAGLDRFLMIVYIFGAGTVAVGGVSIVWMKVVLVSIPIEALLVVLHALFRVTNDRFLNEQEAADEGLLLGV